MWISGRDYAMNEKKSPFGDLCYKYRGRDHLTQQAMGQKIEELGYSLGNLSGGNRQPVISQFEREIDPEGAEHKQHRDPPLDYVEACAKLFNLSSEQKHTLFEAALHSSEYITINTKAIEGEIKNDIIRIIISIILSCAEIDKLKKEDKGRKIETPLHPDQRYLLTIWDLLIKASKEYFDVIKQHALEYKSHTS
jgi:hypothetical protein